MRTRLPTSHAAIRIRISVLDAVCAIVAPALALYFGHALILQADSISAVILYCGLSLVFSIISFLLFRLHDGMPRYFSVHDAFDILKATVFSQLLTTVSLFTITRLDGIPRSTPIYQAAILAAGLVTIRIIAQALQNGGAATRHRDYRIGETIIIIGATEVSSLYIRLLDAVSSGRRRVIALLDDRPRLVGRSMCGVRILGVPHQLSSVIDEFAVHGIQTDRVIIGSETNVLAGEELKTIRETCDDYEIKMDFVGQLIGLSELPPAAANEQLEPKPISIPNFELPHYLKIRPFFDFFAALALIVILSPLLIIGATLALLDLGPPVLFWQQRVGRGGRRILLHKFRTMRAPYDRRGDPVRDRSEPSITGRLLRRTRFDELPQLFNVLVGEMALIGPRPLLPEDQPVESAKRLAMRPGITGWAQVNGGKFLTPEEKDHYDEYYIRNASPWFDLRIILMTLRVLFRFTKHSDHEVAAADRVGFGQPEDRQSKLAANRASRAHGHPRQVESPPIDLSADVSRAAPKRRLVANEKPASVMRRVR